MEEASSCSACLTADDEITFYIIVVYVLVEEVRTMHTNVDLTVKTGRETEAYDKSEISSRESKT